MNILNATELCTSIWLQWRMIRVFNIQKKTQKPQPPMPHLKTHTPSPAAGLFPTPWFLSSPKVTPSNPTLSLSPGPGQGSSLGLQPTLPDVTPTTTTTSIGPSVILQRQHYQKPLGGQSGHILANVHQPWDPMLPLPQLTNEADKQEHPLWIVDRQKDGRG